MSPDWFYKYFLKTKPATFLNVITIKPGMHKYNACLLFALIYTIAYTQPVQKEGRIIVDGLTRSFITWLPAANVKGMPAIISLHGNLGTPKGQLRLADFRPLALQEGFIIVCPAGIDRSWNDGRATKANKKAVDDVHFIDMLISSLIKTYHIDSSRVYITGMSNGGFMASRIACRLSNRIAAAAIVAATMDKDVDYKPLQPVPIMYIHGTGDPYVPYKGGLMTKGAGGNIYGHEEVLKQWAGINHCNMQPTVTYQQALINDGTTITRQEYSCPGGKPVIGYTVNNGGHTWPGGPQYLPKLVVGTASKNLDACRVIWSFFKASHL